MKMLNISKLAKVVRKLVIADVTYSVREMNVQDFIDLTKTAETLIDAKASFSEQLEASVKSICNMTDIPEEIVRKLTLEELSVVTAYVRGSDVGESEIAAEEVEVEGEQEKK